MRTGIGWQTIRLTSRNPCPRTSISADLCSKANPNISPSGLCKRGAKQQLERLSGQSAGRVAAAAAASQDRPGTTSRVKLFPQSFPKCQGQESDLQGGWQPVKEVRSSFKGRGPSLPLLLNPTDQVPTKEPLGPRHSAFKSLASQ